MTITVEQIKAARGLLEWSQDDLADAAILSRPAINNLERRVSKPHTNTMERIQKAFEKAGIEFIDGGVRYRKQILNVEIMEGDSSIFKINADVYDCLKDLPKKDRFLLITGCDERKFAAIGGAKFVALLKKLRDADIITNVLLEEGDTYFLEPIECYRWVPREIFTQVPHFVYGDRYAIILWGPPVKVVVIRNAEIAESYRRQFYAHWHRAKIPILK